MNNLEIFFNAYFAAALWSSHNERTDHSFDHDFDAENFDREFYRSQLSDCQEFLRLSKIDINSVSALKSGHIGHDFWLTRNNHGAGFLDKSAYYGEDESNAYTEAAHSFRSIELFEQNGKIFGE